MGRLCWVWLSNQTGQGRCTRGSSQEVGNGVQETVVLEEGTFGRQVVEWKQPANPTQARQDC
jgi:hypothetical protein